MKTFIIVTRRVWRYQEGNQNPTTQWPNKKGQTTIYKIIHRKLKIE